MKDTYDFVFVSPLPPIISQPPGGINVFYKLSSYLTSKGYKVAIINIKNRYRVPEKFIEKESEKINLRSYPMLPPYLADLGIKATELLFSNNASLNLFQKAMGGDYDYRILGKVDFYSVDESKSVKIKTKRIFATAWQTAYYVEDYLKLNPGTQGFYLIQNFEDREFFAPGKYSEYAKSTYAFKDLRKIVVSKGLYDRFRKDRPLRMIVAIDDIFRLKTKGKRDPFTILVPLRKDESKGASYALEAARILWGESNRYRFTAYGNVDKETVPEYIQYRYKPTNEELSNLYNGAAVFVCPSIIEGFGLPPLEAMASGCAVITTNSIGVKEFARNRSNSLIVPIKDSKAIADAIRLLVKNSRLRNKLVSEGIKTASRFSYNAMYESFISLFER